ncbi:MAG: class I SAM-dependent methyltransferase [Ekhidna sp.]|uniref:class I SAM-dependent methyltransferase n=1 Tax=Ekhidna sp. TaxID=2608089 RepID=UPI0032EBE33F
MTNQVVKSAIAHHNDIQLNYYDGAEKQTMKPVMSPYVMRHIEEFTSFTSFSTNDQLLEVGCGMGKFTFPLLRKGLKITGLDLSPNLLQKLLEYNNNTFQINLISSDILEIPEQYNEQFDHVIGFFTLHHFHHLETYYQAMARILRPGGTITFVEPNAYNPLYYLQILLSPRMTWAGDKGVAMMRKSKFHSAAKYVGLEHLRIRHYGYFPPFLYNTKPGRKIDHFLDKLRVFRPVSAFQIVQLSKPEK